MVSKVCPRCANGDYGRDRRLDGLRHRPTTERPSLSTLQRWVFDERAKATDGCETDPDGFCEHGHSSWLRLLGLI